MCPRCVPLPRCGRCVRGVVGVSEVWPLYPRCFVTEGWPSCPRCVVARDVAHVSEVCHDRGVDEVWPMYPRCAMTELRTRRGPCIRGVAHVSEVWPMYPRCGPCIRGVS